MAVNGCSESLESHRAMGGSQLSCPEHRATREGVPWHSTYPCVLISKTGPLRGSLTSKREQGYSNNDVTLFAPCQLPSCFPSATPYEFGDPGAICDHAPEILPQAGIFECASVPFTTIL